MGFVLGLGGMVIPWGLEVFGEGAFGFGYTPRSWMT
jgi:hypothetical protein